MQWVLCKTEPVLLLLLPALHPLQVMGVVALQRVVLHQLCMDDNASCSDSVVVLPFLRLMQEGQHHYRMPHLESSS